MNFNLRKNMLASDWKNGFACERTCLHRTHIRIVCKFGDDQMDDIEWKLDVARDVRHDNQVMWVVASISVRV